MMRRTVLPVAAVLAFAVGCGDDGSPSDPMAGTEGTTEQETPPVGSTSSGATTGSSTTSGTSTTDPGTSDDTTGADGTGSGSTGPVVMCDYPAGAVDPMALDEVLWPYSWPLAIHGDGTEAALELEDAPCGNDAVIEWSPHDVLLFISIPAW